MKGKEPLWYRVTYNSSTAKRKGKSMGIKRVAGLARNRLLMRVDNSTGKGTSGTRRPRLKRGNQGGSEKPLLTLIKEKEPLWFWVTYNFSTTKENKKDNGIVWKAGLTCYSCACNSLQ
jgi:hypothetical protein